MNIAILSRGPMLYSTRRLQSAALENGHEVRVLDPMLCNLQLSHDGHKILYQNKALQSIDAIIPRIGVSITAAGAALIHHFELNGIFTSLHSRALLAARDKWWALQELGKKDILIPHTIALNHQGNVFELVDQLGGLPVVIKMMESTHGAGVFLAKNYYQLESYIKTFMNLNVRCLVQEFVKEANGQDIRAFVVNGEIVACMLRQAKQGDFRSNLHCGGEAQLVELTPVEQATILKAAKTLGLMVAGVDLLRSRRGPMVLEVNASPGLEGIESATGVNVAGKIIEFVESAATTKPDRPPVLSYRLNPIAG